MGFRFIFVLPCLFLVLAFCLTKIFQPAFPFFPDVTQRERERERERERYICTHTQKHRNTDIKHRASERERERRETRTSNTHIKHAHTDSQTHTHIRTVCIVSFGGRKGDGRNPTCTIVTVILFLVNPEIPKFLAKTVRAELRSINGR